MERKKLSVTLKALFIYSEAVRSTDIVQQI